MKREWRADPTLDLATQGQRPGGAGAGGTERRGGGGPEEGMERGLEGRTGWRIIVEKGTVK